MPNRRMTITQKPLSLKEIFDYLKNKPKIILNDKLQKDIIRSRQIIEKIIASDRPVYGINTGFGSFAETKIAKAAVNELQRRLILSHSAGIGDYIPHDIVRLMMLLKVNALSTGHSACRLEVIQQLIDMLNNDILPQIPQQGSVGASGDLAPLAHLALAMMGGGRVVIDKATRYEQKSEKSTNAMSALKRHGLKPIKFEAKDGLALLNGTQAMTAFALWTLMQLKNIIKSADIIGALSLETLLGSLTPFDTRIQEIRPHPGQKIVAENVRKILHDSPIVLSHKFSDHKVQDAYSLRCMPQVHGAVRDGLAFIEEVILREINSVTDNPLLFVENGEVLSGGNFHGAPIAYASDFMSIILTDLASISERRIEHMLDPAVSQLPAFLIEEGGLNSGFMMAHVSAASLVSECKSLAHPASTDSIPTSANKEDHVSMGMYAARKSWQIMKNLEHVLAIELICACQALDFRAPLKPSKVTGNVLKLIRATIPFWKQDRLMYQDINAAVEIIRSKRLVQTAEKICGELK